MSFAKFLGLNSKPDILVEPLFDAKPPLYVIYPHANNPGSQAPKSTTITGRFKVTLKKPETFVEIYTTITPNWYITNKRVTDTGSLPSYSCRIQHSDGVLDVGEHDFPFIFNLPCTTWPRASILHDYRPTGQVINDISTFNMWYALELVIQRRQPDGSLAKFTAEFPNRKKATVLDGGIAEWKEIYHNRFFAMIASPVDPGEMPPPLERVIEEFAPQIGPINVLMTSRVFTPGALITLNIKLPDVPSDTTWRGIRASVHQTFTWRSLNADGPSFVEGPYIFPFMSLEAPFVDQEEGTGISIVQTVRMPDDRYLAPTTLKHTITPNNISHQIVLEFEVVDGRKQKKIVNIREPVTLASCMLISEWLNVPRYGASTPARSDFQPERPKDVFSCACGFRLEQLVEREEEGLLSPEEYEPPPLKERPD